MLESSAGSSRAEGSQEGMTMMGWYGSGMGGAGPFMWMFMGVFWIALIGLIIWLVVKLLPGSGANQRTTSLGGAGPVESPEQVLDRLFAMGEIDETTYRTRRTALTEMRRPS
jgi:putative membrane protein